MLPDGSMPIQGMWQKLTFTDHSKDIHFYKHLLCMGKKVQKPDKLCSKKTVQIQHHNLYSIILMRTGIMIFKIQ
jgi:hypothetical protein